MKMPILTITILSVTILLSSCSTKISDTPKPSANMEASISSPYEKLDKLPQKYSPELAQRNGDVVGVHGKGYNVEKLDKFIQASKTKKGDMVRITTYTVEGDAIIYDLSKNSEGFKLICDNTRDKFGIKEKTEYNVTGFSKQNKDGGTIYIAQIDKGNDFPLLFINKD